MALPFLRLPSINEGPLNRDIRAVAAGFVLAMALTLAERWALWPLLFGLGRFDLSHPLVRMVFTFVGALPVVAGGYLAARMAATNPLRQGITVGALLILPMLFSLAVVLRAHHDAPQSSVPWMIALALRPIGGALGAVLTGRVTNLDQSAGSPAKAGQP